MTTANQRLLNESAEHINQQGCQSTGDGGCLYTFEVSDGRTIHCALWPAIDVYHEGMEETSFQDLLMYDDGIKDWARDIDPGFADAIQSAHDHSNCYDLNDREFLNEFNEGIRLIASRYSLKVPAVSA